jgi:hypothetical protein
MKPTRIGFALLVIALFAGCSAKPATTLDDNGPGGSIIVTTGADGQIVTVAGDAGAILGTVVNDIGVPVATSHIALLGTDYSTFSNKSGRFELLNVTAGTHTMRVDHMDYRATEQQIQVAAGQVTQLSVTLVPKVSVGAGYRPHLHDYWGGAVEKVVIDQTFDWHEPYDHDAPYAGGAGEVQRYYSTATQASGTHPCLYTGPNEKQNQLYFNNRLIWFNDPAQTVYEGTAAIEVKLDWTSNDAPVEELILGYRAANMTNYEVTTPIKKGVPFTLPVSPEMWDSGHQAFTLWDFGLCVAYETEIPADGKFFIGKVKVFMKLIRGHEILPEPPHPNFWANGSEVLVIDGLKKSTSAQYATSRSQYRGDFFVKPTGSKLVPPGTKTLRATLEWTYSGPAPQPKAWSLTYRPANVNPRSYDGPGDFQKVAPTESGATKRVYDIPIKPGESDAFYQQRSNWGFMLNLEGEEASSNWVNPCGNCKIEFKIDAVAIQDPAYGDAAATT